MGGRKKKGGGWVGERSRAVDGWKKEEGRRMGGRRRRTVNRWEKEVGQWMGGTNIDQKIVIVWTGPTFLVQLLVALLT